MRIEVWIAARSIHREVDSHQAVCSVVLVRRGEAVERRNAPACVKGAWRDELSLVAVGVVAHHGCDISGRRPRDHGNEGLIDPSHSVELVVAISGRIGVRIHGLRHIAVKVVRPLA